MCFEIITTAFAYIHNHREVCPRPWKLALTCLDAMSGLSQLAFEILNYPFKASIAEASHSVGVVESEYYFSVIIYSIVIVDNYALNGLKIEAH